MNIPPTWDYLPGAAPAPAQSSGPANGWAALSENERIGLLLLGAWVVLELL